MPLRISLTTSSSLSQRPTPAAISLAESLGFLFAQAIARSQARYFTASQRAHEVAESAVHRLVALLATPERLEVLETGRYTGTVSSEGETANRFQVSIWSAADDGADNDQDGRADEEDEADLYESAPLQPNIMRALSLVPDHVRMLQSESRSHYVPLPVLSDMSVGRDLDRMQIELVAARVSALNECFY